MWKNRANAYGLPAVLLHWLSALAVFGLFGLGLWMGGLDYYDRWYRDAPFIHKSVGLLLFGASLLRLGWALSNPKPAPLGAAWEQRAVHVVHVLLYLLLFAVMLSGYLISTADGRGISLFGWFEVPALLAQGEPQAELAGEVHEILAFTLVGLAGLHALAALKHHFFNRDDTLRRMLGLAPRRVL